MAEPTIDKRTGPGGMLLEETGHGERVLLVHGGGASGLAAFKPQLELAEQYRLIAVTRLGYPGSAATSREDFEVDARLLTEVMGPSCHLIGHSYGAVVAALAASQRPDAVRSLTMMDAACSGVARGTPIVDAYEAEMGRLVAAPPSDPSAFVRAVFAILDSQMKLPDPLPPPLVAFGARLYHLRWPWEANMPLERLRELPFPKLIVSGGRNPLYEVISDVLTSQLGAERFVIEAAGHHFENGAAALTDRLRRFLAQASVQRAAS